ncbi:hypothetical protein [Pedobacter sp. SYSU D00535]|uniref:hypothetical protein n=1 Tax=Pedobacter sp. SYSU D00535 TaxID=2810308 RepID=UPI001A974F00|nr:hypothetical protein [Pedobacter sp. SYSU D00535]
MKTPIPATVTKQEDGLFLIEAQNPYTKFINKDNVTKHWSQFKATHPPKITDEDLTGVEQVNWNSFNIEVHQAFSEDFGKWYEDPYIPQIKELAFKTRTIWRREAAELTEKEEGEKLHDCLKCDSFPVDTPNSICKYCNWPDGQKQEPIKEREQEPEKKTLLQCKDEIASRYGYESYGQFCFGTPREPEHDDWDFHLRLVDDAVELYVSQFVSSQEEKQTRELREEDDLEQLYFNWKDTDTDLSFTAYANQKGYRITKE